jgi:hypothetical protein
VPVSRAAVIAFVVVGIVLTAVMAYGISLYQFARHASRIGIVD